MAGQKFLQTGATGGFAEAHGTQTSTGAAMANAIVALTALGLLDISLMPVGIGPDTAVMTASEAIVAGGLVNIWNNGGVFSIRNADGSTTGKEAHGFILAAVASSANATVYFNGTNNAVTGLTPGPQFLSATTVGAATATIPTAAGQTVQRVGIATSATSLNFTLEPPITLA